MGLTMKLVTISLTRYKEPNSLLHDCLGSISTQKNIQAKVLVLDQQDSSDTRKFCESISSNSIKFIYHVIDEVSLSYARNQAIALSDTDILLYIDPDAIADLNWAFELGSILHRGAAVAGGKIIPYWHKKMPWICRSLIIREQYSILDLENETFPTNRIFGTNFGIHLKLLGKHAYFDLELGRKNGNLMGGEETDLCDRAKKNGCQIFYCGSAIVTHKILSERINYRWIWRRIIYTGRNRAVRGGMINPINKLSVWDYIIIPLFLIPYSFGYFHQKLTFKK